MAVDMMEQVKQMLLQAESTNHESEAALIWERLQTLASRHQIDLAMLRQQAQKSQRREEVTQKVIDIADTKLKERRFYVDLFLAIANANDVKCDIASNATRVYAYGFPSDIELAEVLYVSLVHRMVSDATAYIKTGEYKNDKQMLPIKRRIPNPDAGRYDPYTGGGEPKYIYEWSTEYRALSALTVRRNFYEAFISRIGQRLRAARKEAIKQADAESPLVAAAVEGSNGEQKPATPGAQLVLLRKAEEVRDYYKQQSNAKGSYRGGSAVHYSQGGRSAGASSANDAHIGRADRELPGQGKALGR